MLLARIAFLLVLCVSSLAYSAGLSSDDNFIVITQAKSTQEAAKKYADRLLKEAARFRAEFAEDWLGQELVPGSGRTIISVRFSESENSAITWAKDDPSRKFHNIYLTTSPALALGYTLHHELVHAVLATEYPDPDRLPPWTEEGIASRYDNPSLIAVRQQEVLAWKRAGQAPGLTGLLEASNIHSFDDGYYAAAESLVSYLLTLGDKQTILQFAKAGQHDGWEVALQDHYGIESIHRLQSQWQDWIFESVR
jgi:hypothetical protein